jgi:hypothetical protein
MTTARLRNRERCAGPMWRPSERWRSGWDGEFESPLLQRGVRCELDPTASATYLLRATRPHRRSPYWRAQDNHPAQPPSYLSAARRRNFRFIALGLGKAAMSTLLMIAQHPAQLVDTISCSTCFRSGRFSIIYAGIMP